MTDTISPELQWRFSIYWTLTILFIIGAIILAWPVQGFGLYPALVGVSLMCGSVFAGLLYSGEGTIPDRVEAHRMELGSLVILTFVALGLAFLWESKLFALQQKTPAIALEGVGIMGVMILVGTMLGVNLLSPERGLRGNEVRTAIAVSVIAVFFGLIAVGSNFELTDKSLLSATFEHFWKVLIAVVGFYFGSLAIETVANNIQRNTLPGQLEITEEKGGNSADASEAEPRSDAPQVG